MDLKLLKDLVKQHKLKPKQLAQIVAIYNTIDTSKDPAKLAQNFLFHLVSFIAHQVVQQNPSPQLWNAYIRDLESSFRAGILVGEDLGIATREQGGQRHFPKAKADLRTDAKLLLQKAHKQA